MHIPYNPKILPLGIYLTEMQIFCLPEDMNNNVHCITIYDSPNIEIFKCPWLVEWINCSIVINEIQGEYKNIRAIFNIVDESHKYNVEWKKLESKDTYWWSYLYRVQIFVVRCQDGVYPWRGSTKRRCEEFLGRSNVLCLKDIFLT